MSTQEIIFLFFEINDNLLRVERDTSDSLVNFPALLLTSLFSSFLLSIFQSFFISSDHRCWVQFVLSIIRSLYVEETTKMKIFEADTCSGRSSAVFDIRNCDLSFSPVSFSFIICLCPTILLSINIKTRSFKTFHDMLPLQSFKQFFHPASTALDTFWRRLSLYHVFRIFLQECFSGMKIPT